VARRLDEGSLSMHALLADLNLFKIDAAPLRAHDPTLRCLANVNTPEDLAAFTSD
jgi:hypothetical protein